MTTTIESKSERHDKIVNFVIEHYLKTGEGTTVKTVIQHTQYTEGIVRRVLNDTFSLRSEMVAERTQSKDYPCFEMGTTRRQYFYPTLSRLRQLLLKEREERDRLLAKQTWPN